MQYRVVIECPEDDTPNYLMDVGRPGSSQTADHTCAERFDALADAELAAVWYVNNHATPDEQVSIEKLTPTGPVLVLYTSRASHR